MDNYVFYCPKCEQAFVGEGHKVSERPGCPNCGTKTMATGMKKGEWKLLSKEARSAHIEKLVQQDQEQAKREAHAQALGIAYEKDNNDNGFFDTWYADIGKKIKGWAIWIFVVEAIISLLGAAVMLIAGIYNENFMLVLMALISGVTGPFVAWVSSWLLYGFGELIDKTVDNEKNTRNILELMLENNTQDR